MQIYYFRTNFKPTYKKFNHFSNKKKVTINRYINNINCSLDVRNSLLIFKYQLHRFSEKIKESDPNKDLVDTNDSLSIHTLKNNITLRRYENSLSEIEDSTSSLPTKLNPNDIDELEIFISDKTLSKADNFILYKQFLDRKAFYEKQKTKQKIRVAGALFILLVGMFSLFVPLYKTICERQGYSVKTTHVDYKFDGKKLNVMKKFTVKFVEEVDAELPWTFEPLQEKVVINAGETCLAFYRAKNMCDEPVIGLAVYDIHPQSVSMYFNKIQCFCFENQLLAPNEEVDLPVFFYIDPAINDDPQLEEYTEFNLKYSYYLAKKQDLAKVMAEHLKKEKIEHEKLNQRKRELNKLGRSYKIDEENKFSGLSGVNPQLTEYYIQRVENDNDLNNKNVQQ